MGDVGSADLAILESSQRSRLLTAFAAILNTGDSPDHIRRHDVIPPTPPGMSWAVLVAVQRRAPDALDEVLRDPAVGAWAFRLLRRVAYGAAAEQGGEPPARAGANLFATLAAAAAIRAGMPCSLRIPARRGRLWLPSLGMTGTVGRGEWAIVGVESRAHGTVVFGDSGSVRLPDDLSRPAEGWSPVPVIDVTEQGRRLLLDHLSPYRDFRGVRDPAWLPAKDVRRWRELLREAYELLRARHPAAHRTVTRTVRSLVPVDGRSALRVVSATVPDAYGAITMSLPADAVSLAVTLVHEARHQLLSTIDDLTPLFTPVLEGPEPAYFAPWRGDPRPLRGLLYGAHAFMGVAVFWQNQRHEGGERADFEFALHRWQLRIALAALRGATGLTEAGGRIVATLAEAGRALWREPVHGTAAWLADLCCRDILAGWRAAHLVVRENDAAALARRWSAGLPPPRSLPGTRIGEHHPALPGDGRTWLARLRCTDQEAFERARALADGPLGIADVALISGDPAKALPLYRSASADPGAWIGMGLAGDSRTSPLLERPELVLALHAALRRDGVRPPGPEELAEWLSAARC